MSIAALARAMPISAGAISQWEMTTESRTDPSHENAAKVAKILSVDLTWLLTGDSNSGLEFGVDVGEPEGRRVPLLSASEIVEKKHEGRVAYAPMACGPDSFAHIIASGVGGAMLARGAMIVVDPAVAIEPGTIALAVADKRVVIGRVSIAKGDGKARRYTVTPLAPGWEAEAVQAKDILGSVVQATTRVE